jgi:DNA mismatch repair protein MutS
MQVPEEVDSSPRATSTSGDAPPLSVLFGPARPAGADSCPEPDYFHDSNLDQVCVALVGADELQIRPFFHLRCADPDLVMMRHAVFADLEDPAVGAALASFSEEMSTIREQVAGLSKIHHRLRRERWHLLIAERYCTCVERLAHALAEPDAPSGDPSSQALREAATYLVGYTSTPHFLTMRARIDDLQARLRATVFNAYLTGGRVTVGPFDDEADYRSEIVDLFARFRRHGQHDPEWRDARKRPGTGKPRRKNPISPESAVSRIYTRNKPTPSQFEASADPIRERIIELVARLEPQLFRELRQFTVDNPHYLDETVLRFHRELQFYLGYVRLIDRLRAAGLPFTTARLTDTDRLVAHDTYDLALALSKSEPQPQAGKPDRRPTSSTTALTAREKNGVGIVCNDLQLTGTEQTLVVTGPNQGGKTTLARTVIQLHHLAALGCPVPGTQVRLRLPDAIFTHFERQELVTVREGKLGDDLRRIHSILDRATDKSIIVLNEIFSSTSAADAAELGTAVLTAVHDIGATCVCVTFLDELSRLDADTVSMVATVGVNDPTERTLKLVRRPADGRSYAAALAAKHRLTYVDITQRLAR